MGLAAAPCRGRETLIENLFGPVGYEVEAEADDIDDAELEKLMARITRTEI